MFEVNNDLSIHITRGDIALLTVTADSGNAAYVFEKGDIVRLKVYEKKGCDCVVLMKDITVEETTEKVDILLTGDDTRIGEVIHKPKDYWYEVELNPDTNPQTIIGYDENGAKVFRLYPEGKEIEYEPGDDINVLEQLVEKEVEEYLTENPPEDGEKGEKGADGYSPVRGVDYWTDADKTEIVNETAENIPTASADTRGVVKIGNGLKMDGETLNFDNGKWECIEKICFGYELLTEQPDDWDTAKTTKYYYANVDGNSKMTLCPSWFNWESNKYWKYTGEYDAQVQKIQRNQEPDGTPYNLKCVSVFGHIFNPSKVGLWCFSAYLNSNYIESNSMAGVATLAVSGATTPYHFNYRVTQENGIYNLLCFSGGQGDKTAVTGVSNAASGMMMKPSTSGNIKAISAHIWSAKEYYSEGDYIEIWGVRADG